MFSGPDWHTSVLEPHIWQDLNTFFKFWVQRDDQIHPIVSGNKSRKLLGWLEAFHKDSYEGIVTFGGAYSNHIIATACVAADYHIPCVGLIRGDEGVSNEYLNYAHSKGMELVFISREAYRNKLHLSDQYVDFNNRKNLVIPEGGAGELGLIGFESLVHYWLEQDMLPDIVVHASATATTAAGLAKALNKIGASTRVIAIMVLKNELEQREHLTQWGIFDEVELINDYHFGGYAKMPEALMKFIEEAQSRTNIPLEPVYSGKAFYALVHKILPENPDKKICFLHTGGMGV